MAGIFKAYDIRGIYPKELNEETAYLIGRAFVLEEKMKKVVVGRDCRTSSPQLMQSLKKGICDQGADVVDIGLTSTPMFYFAVVYYGFSGGIMVTASHNPKEYNGAKMVRAQAMPLSYEEGIRQIEQTVKLGLPLAQGKYGKKESKEVLPDYVKHILKFANVQGLKIVVDSANGMAGLTFPEVYKKLNLQVTHIFKDLDGSFPNHEPDPLKPENCQALQKEVKRQKADIGICFDADADKVIFIDEKSDIVSSDLILILLAQEQKKLDPKSRLIYDCRSTQVIKELFGPSAIEHRVGHTYIKKSMRDLDVPLAGELSGHFYFKDSFFFDDAVLAAIKVLTIISKAQKPLSELIRPFQRYHKSPETNFHVPSPQDSIRKIESHFKDLKIERIDGITIKGKGFWFNARASNTEPVLRIVMEADTGSLLKEKMNLVRSIIIS